MRTARLLTVSQHALPRGVSAREEGRCLPKGCLPRWVCPSGCLPRGCAQGGVCPTGVLRWCVSLTGGCVADTPQTRGRHTPREENDWQTGVKTLPCRNFVEGGNKCVQISHLDVFMEQINIYTFLWSLLRRDVVSLHKLYHSTLSIVLNSLSLVLESCHDKQWRIQDFPAGGRGGQLHPLDPPMIRTDRKKH